MLAEHVARQRGADGEVDRAAALAAYGADRPEHCRRVLTTGRAWGELWHLGGEQRLQRNATPRARDVRDVRDYAFTDWVYGPTARTPRRGARDVPADPPLGRARRRPLTGV